MALKKTKPSKTWIIIPGLALGVVLLSAYRRSLKPLGPILARMRLRGQDQHGYGYFGASRSGGSRQHNGIDLVCTPGEAVFSPITGTVERYANPYPGDSRYGGILLQGEELSVKMFYLSAVVPVGTKVRRGQQVGIAQAISKKYPGITEHIHVEVYAGGQLVNPAELFEYQV